MFTCRLHPWIVETVALIFHPASKVGVKFEKVYSKLSERPVRESLFETLNYIVSYIANGNLWLRDEWWLGYPWCFVFVRHVYSKLMNVKNDTSSVLYLFCPLPLLPFTFSALYHSTSLYLMMVVMNDAPLAPWEPLPWRPTNRIDHIHSTAKIFTHNEKSIKSINTCAYYNV